MEDLPYTQSTVPFSGMIYCLNSHCRDRLNPEDCKFCQSCGFQLLLRNRYRVIKFMGGGGFGRTYQAVDQDCMNMPCVVKQFSPSLDIQSEPIALQKATEMFYQEAVRLLQLGEHPQIPRLLAYFEQEKHLYLVQELIEGYDLRQELAIEGAFSEQKIRQLLANMLPVLKFIHTHSVIHRDIKPGNIMRRHKDGKLMLIDFGVSKLETGTLLGKVGTKVGTVGFTPLEQMRGKAYSASDLYSLGVTCVCLLTQCFPTGDGFDEFYDPIEACWKWREYLPPGKTISSQLGQILDKLLQDLPKNRYQSADEVLKDLNPANTSLLEKENRAKENREFSVSEGGKAQRKARSDETETANPNVSQQQVPMGRANAPGNSVSATEHESKQGKHRPASSGATPRFPFELATPTPSKKADAPKIATDSRSQSVPEGESQTLPANVQSASPTSYSLVPSSQPTVRLSDSSSTSLEPVFIPADQLISAVGIDYTQLRKLLAAEKWKEADFATTLILLKVSGREQEGWLRAEDFKNFPCPDLGTIDQLWVNYSKGRFGFSVQRSIWESVGGTSDIDYKAWCHFGDRLGWRVNGNWLSYSELTFNREAAPLGHLPAGGSNDIVLGKWDLVCCSLASRLRDCKI